MEILCLKNTFNIFNNLVKIFVIILFSEFSNSTGIREMIWAKDPTYGGLTLSTNYLWQKSARTRLKCSVLCTADTECGAFFFSDSDKSCLASTFLLSATSQGTADVGSEYYFHRPDLCPSTYEYNRKLNLCIKVFKLSRTWNGAKAECEAETNGGLVTIWNQEIMDFVASELDRLSVPINAYIDGNDMVTESIFVSKDGTNLTFFDWDPSYPDGYHEWSDALVINPARKMIHFDHTYTNYFVCEIVM